MTTQDTFDKLAQLSTRAALFSGISMLLEWDQETFMPKNAIPFRSQQVELIASLHHKEKTSKEFAKALADLIDLETGKVLAKDLNGEQAACLREWRRDYQLDAKLPTKFVEEWAKTTSEATHFWAEAKERNDFKTFEPHLEKVVQLARQKAEHLGYEEHPYDALLDQFEQGMTIRKLSPLLERLKIPLLALVKKIQTKTAPDTSFLEKTYPHDQQLAVGKKILADMGFEKSFSRLDESAHPMCIPAHPNDMRMTTRVYPNQMAVNILSCIHEGGHGLYHTNLPVEHFGTPLCEAASLGIDESQSRTWETIIGRSKPFWQHYLPLLQETYPEQLTGVTLDAFYKGLNIVKPTLIRTDSDEVTYNLHIMVRFELEKALIEKEIEAADIPSAWNEKMREYLGITPSAHSVGCLQDIHWSLGAIGYFPTYTLGNLYAAQFLQKFANDHPDWKERVSKGELTFIASWQKEHIHRFGRQFLPDELCERVTGKPLSHEPFIAYLEEKYIPLYQL